MNGILRLKDLKNISGNITKQNYIKEHSDDIEFIECLKFLIDDKVLTGINRKKLNKEINQYFGLFASDILTFLKEIKGKSGSDYDIVNGRVTLNSLDTERRDILEGIICKDYKVGISTKLYNLCMPDDKITDQPYCGANSYSKKKAEDLFRKHDYAYSEEKCDGAFVNIHLYEDNIHFTGRSGLQIFIEGGFIKDVESLNCDLDVVLTGEIMVNGYSRKVANGMLQSYSDTISKNTEKSYKDFIKKYGLTTEEFQELIYAEVWDCIPKNDFENRKSTFKLKNRYKKVCEIVKSSKLIKPVEHRIVYSLKEALEHFKEITRKGGEGTVLKAEGDWKDGKPTTNLKLKIEFEMELEIVGFREGKAKSKFEGSLGSLIAQSSEGLLISGISGLDEKSGIRDLIWNNQSEYLGKIITVKCNGLSTNKKDIGKYSLLYGNFIEFREDKELANSLDEIFEIEKMALELN